MFAVVRLVSINYVFLTHKKVILCTELTYGTDLYNTFTVYFLYRIFAVIFTKKKKTPIQ